MRGGLQRTAAHGVATVMVITSIALNDVLGTPGRSIGERKKRTRCQSVTGVHRQHNEVRFTS